MDYTVRMLRLLGDLRRERNGAVADAMRFYGRPYGLNYGVSLPTVRRLAQAEGTDDGFARYLYAQDVRELKLAACGIADPAATDAPEAEYWGAGLLNSELAEELAFALLSRTERIAEVFGAWTKEGRPALQCYAALLGAARNPKLTTAFLPAVAGAVRCNPDDRLTARGAVALLEKLYENEENRDAVIRFVGSLDASPSADSIREEMAWRMEVQ